VRWYLKRRNAGAATYRITVASDARRVIDSVNAVRRHFAPPPSPGARIQELGDTLAGPAASAAVGVRWSQR
jgi:hypothetical protein